MTAAKLTTTSLLAALLVGCASRHAEDSSHLLPSVVVKSDDRSRPGDHTDDSGHPLPRDKRHLSIRLPDGPQVIFVVPAGWYIIQQPERTQNFIYVLARVGSREEPHIWVSCDKARVVHDTNQETLQADRLHGYRSGPFGYAGMEQDSTQNSADGNFVFVNYYVGADGEKLVAIIPEKGLKTEVFLEAQSREDITANRPAFLAVLHSLHTR